MLVLRGKGEIICKFRLYAAVAILKSPWPEEGYRLDVPNTRHMILNDFPCLSMGC